MIHLQKKIIQVRFGAALLHDLASLYIYAIFRCSSKHAVDRRNRGKVPQMDRRTLACHTPGCNGKRISPAVAHPPVHNARKTVVWLACEVADQIFGSGNGLPNRLWLVLVACLDFPICAIFSNSPALPITKAVSLHRQPPPKFAEFENHQPPRTESLRPTSIPASTRASRKAQCLELESVPLAG
jgi:hypothetical protein